MGVILFLISMLFIVIIVEDDQPAAQRVHRRTGRGVTKMSTISRKPFLLVLGQAAMLGLLYLFLYFPIMFIIYVSFVDNTVWPFPPE